VVALLAGPPVVWLAAFFLAPLSIIGAYSFGDTVGLTRIAIDGTLANYAHAMRPLYLGIIAKSLAFAVLTTALCLVVGFPVAVAISFAKPKTKAWLLLLIMLPFWTNLLIRTYALMAVLRPLGLLHTDAAVVFGLVYVQLPFMVLPLYAALDRLDRSLIEASLDLGSGHLGAFARVVAPLALPGIVSGVLLTLIPAIGAYLTPDLLGGPSSLMVANVIERQFKAADDWPFGAALSFLLMYLTFIAMAAQALAARRRGGER
jgi:spermidine/putrescine transport system permease protein